MRPFFAVLINLMAYTGGLSAAGADNLHLAGINSGLCFHDTALLAHLAGFHMLLNLVDALYNNFAFFGANSQNLAGTALAFLFELVIVIANAQDDGVTHFYMNLTSSVNTSIKALQGKAQNLHIVLVAQLSGNRPKDTSASGVLIFSDDNGGVFIKTDVGAVVTANTGCSTNNLLPSQRRPF